jgi:flagellar biosynthesis protein FlhF
MFEVLAGDAEGADEWRPGYFTRGTAPELTCVAPLEVPNVKRNPRSSHPLKIALVGPTGAGKTTTIAKLIGHPRIFGTKAVGLLSLDTYRIGAVEQLRTYADIAHVPLEVVYETADVQRCFSRLADLEVVLIDTPGRGPRSRRDRAVVDHWFRLIAPDEVHLTLPAGLQRQLVTETVKRYLGGNSITHILPTKLDEMWSDWTVFELAAELHVPMRWVTDGQEVPADIRGASPRLLAALASSQSRAEAMVGGAA